MHLHDEFCRHRELCNHAPPSIMARLMMSAAVPCMGALIALRSAYWRSAWFRDWISGRCTSRRPEDRFHEASFARLSPGLFHVTLHPGIALE